MIDENLTATIDLRDVEAELCRLPDVGAVRIVADDLGRPVEIHVLAHTGKQPKQIVRDIQSVTLASFGLEIDRRIVSVVQLGANGDATPAAPHPPPSRPRICSIDARTSGMRTTIRVHLTLGDDEATGFAEGTVAAAARPRLVATATIDALRQLEVAAEALDVESAQCVRVGADDVAVVNVVMVEPTHEHHLSGSAIVRRHADDAVVRAALDAVNRRLPYLTPDRRDT